MTEHDQDFARYLDDLIEVCELLETYTEICQQTMEEQSHHWLMLNSNLKRLKRKMPEEMMPYFRGGRTFLAPRRDLYEDIQFLVTAITNMNRIHRYGL